MKVRHKETDTIGYTSQYNRSAVSPSEIIVWYEDGSASSDYTRDYDPADPNLTHEDMIRYLDQLEYGR